MQENDNFIGWSCEMINSPDCKFLSKYSEGSKYEGFLAIDDLKFKSELNNQSQNYKHVFGCATKETGLLRE